MNRRPPSERRAAAAAHHRSDRKERNRKKRDFLGALRVLSVLLVAGECLRVLFMSPRLALHTVRVSGSPRFTVADVQRLGGIRLGQNLFRVNLSRVSERLRTDPVIREAVVTRELPSTLRVELQERVPALQVASAGKVWLADDSGVVYQRAASVDPRLPSLDLQAKDMSPVGGTLRPELLFAAQECTRLAAEQHLRTDKMRVDGSEELWLNVASSASGQAGSELPVRVGRLTDLPEKFRDIHQALQARPDLPTRATCLNVMCAGRPAYIAVPDSDRGTRTARATEQD